MLFRYDIKKGDYVNRWMVSDLSANRYIGEKLAFERDDNLVGSDWSKIVYPIRKEYLTKPQSTEHRYINKGIDNFYVPFESERIEASGFYHECHELEFHAMGHIICKEDKYLPIELTACGSVAIYINGEEKVKFSPYTRNAGTKTKIELPLLKGRNEVVISCKDLAERDISNYFQIHYLGEEDICMELPVDVNLEKLTYIEKHLQEAYLEKENYLSEDIRIIFPKENKTEFKYSINSAKSVDSAFIDLEDNRKIFKKGDTSLLVGSSRNYKIGFHKLIVSVYLNDVEIKRDFNVEIYPTECKNLTGINLKDRKKKALEFMGVHGNDGIQKTLGILDFHKKLDDNQKAMLFHEVDRINRRVDCSDFRMPALIWIYKKYKEFFTEQEILRMKEAILNYRYWMDEPGNDVMWFFSENHALAFHTSELLAGEVFEDEIFSNCGMKGTDHVEKAKELLDRWFTEFEKAGYGEWNSAVYLPIDMISCFSLYELAKDEEIRIKAKKVLDRTFEIFAKNSYHGIITSSQGRAYEKELRGRRTTEGSALCWIAWGEGYLNQHVFATTLFAVSSYKPPCELEETALYNKDEGIEIEYEEGPERVRLYMYKTKDYSIASVLDYKEFIHGHQEHVFQVNVGDTPESQVWINHPGENKINGVGRPSYFAGNGILPKIKQNKNKVELEFDTQDHEVDFTHAYTPLEYFDEYKEVGKWLFLRRLEGYIGIYAENGYEITTSGPLKDREIKSYGRKNRWKVVAGSKIEYQCFEKFIENIIN